MPLQILLFAPSSSREMRVPFAENRRSSSMPPFNANHTTHVHSIYFSRRLANVSILFTTSSRHGDVPGRGRRFGHRDRSPLLDVPGHPPAVPVHERPELHDDVVDVLVRLEVPARIEPEQFSTRPRNAACHRRHHIAEESGSGGGRQRRRRGVEPDDPPGIPPPPRR